LLEEWAAHYQASADECNQDLPETMVPDLWDISVRVSPFKITWHLYLIMLY